jgi:hypothetical protein
MKNKILLALFAGLLSSIQMGQASDGPGPIAGTWRSPQDPKLSLKIVPKKKTLQFTLNPPQGESPKSIGLVLMRSDGTVVPLELMTLKKSASGTSYGGNFVGDHQSFVGFELNIPMLGRTSKTLKSSDLQKVDFTH